MSMDLMCVFVQGGQFGLALTFNLDFSFPKWWIGSLAQVEVQNWPQPLTLCKPTLLLL